MCEPTFEEWFLNFAGELSRLNGMTIDFDTAYDLYLPAFENGTCGGTCARHVVGSEIAADLWEDAE